MELDKIRTKEDLKKVLAFLEEEGFGYFSDYKLHNSKIESIINKANKLKIDITNKSNLTADLYNYNNYEEAEKKANDIFSKFDSGHKISEIIGKFYITNGERCETPNYSDDAKDVIEWYQFKTKYNLKDEFGVNKAVEYYNLDTNFLKVNYREYSKYDFKNLYKLIYGEDLQDYNEPGYNSKTIYGEWYNLGRIEIKFFQNGNLAIKGDIDKLKEQYYKYLISKVYNHTVIMYNKKLNIFKSTRKED